MIAADAPIPGGIASVVIGLMLALSITGLFIDWRNDRDRR